MRSQPSGSEILEQPRRQVLCIESLDIYWCTGERVAIGLPGVLLFLSYGLRTFCSFLVVAYISVSCFLPFGRFCSLFSRVHCAAASHRPGPVSPIRDLLFFSAILVWIVELMHLQQHWWLFNLEMECIINFLYGVRSDWIASFGFKYLPVSF